MSFLIEKYAFRQGCCTLDVAASAPEFKVAIRGPCYHCSEPQEVIVDDAALRKFRAGKFAQDCFPTLPAEQREFLISGICGKCWNEMFPDAEEETEEE
jgi:hypothetical protein